MPGTTTPQPNCVPRLWVTQTALPSRSATEKLVVCSFAGSGFWGAHCSVSPSSGRGSRTRARSVSTSSSASMRASAAGPGLLWAMRMPAASRIARQTTSR